MVSGNVAVKMKVYMGKIWEFLKTKMKKDCMHMYSKKSMLKSQQNSYFPIFIVAFSQAK